MMGADAAATVFFSSLIGGDRAGSGGSVGDRTWIEGDGDDGGGRISMEGDGDDSEHTDNSDMQKQQNEAIKQTWNRHHKCRNDMIHKTPQARLVAHDEKQTEMV